MAGAVQLDRCANCILFKWDEAEEGSLPQQCSKCTVLQYCSKSCQVEHWKLVHKNHQAGLICRAIMDCNRSLKLPLSIYKML